MRALALAVPVVGLLAGLFLGWSLVPDPGPAPASRSELSTPREDAPVRPRADPTAPAPATTTPAEESPGTGRIEGRVTTPDGDPVEGVVVLAFRHRPREEPWRIHAKPTLDGAGPPDLDRALAERLEEIERDRTYRLATRRSAVSGEDGRFVLSGLADGHHGIRAFREGWEVRQEGDHGGGGRPGEFLKLIATPVVRMPVRVTLPEGGQPARAEILVGRDRHPWTPDRAGIDLLAGSVEFRARVPGRDLASDPVTVAVTAGGPLPTVDLRLRRQRGIRGVVTFPPGIGPAFHELVALLLLEGSDPSPRRLRAEGKRIHLDAFSGSRVAYADTDLEPGRYLVGIRRSREVLVSTEVTVGNRIETLDFVVPGADEEPAILTIRVLDPDGKPESRVSPDPVWVDARGNARRAGSVKRVRPGVWRVRGVARKEGHTFRLRLRSKLYGNRSVEVDLEMHDEITIRLEAPAFLTVTLEGWADSRAEGVTRIAVAPAGHGDPRPFPRSPPPEPEGRQTFGPFAPGPFEVGVWVSPSSSFVPLVRQPVTLVSGKNQATVAIPALFVLEVLVEGKDGEKGFYLQRLEGRGPTGSIPRFVDGRVRFEHLTAGEYVLSRHHGTREHMPLTITSDRVVRFLPIVLDALLVRIDDAAGLLARGGLRSGDLVLAIDGKEITGEREGRALLALAESRGRGTLRVRREGKVLDVALELAGVRDARKAGGELRPWTR